MTKFNGSDYIPSLDDKRLTTQHERVKQAMSFGRWLTLSELEVITGDNQASISAQIRHLRKKRFGGFTIEKQRRGRAGNGLFEYRLVFPNEQMSLFLITAQVK